MKLKLPPQVIRVALLAAGIVAVYSSARALLTPPSFGEYGWYRGAALEELAAAPPVFAGQRACEECHDEQIKMVAAHAHKTVSCEACHGPGQEHAENPDVAMRILTYSHCVACHERNLSRPSWLKQVDTKEHAEGSKCTDCHEPHNP